jgi:hypothetical protein
MRTSTGFTFRLKRIKGGPSLLLLLVLVVLPWAENVSFTEIDAAIWSWLDYHVIREDLVHFAKDQMYPFTERGRWCDGRCWR